jgi:hypothetical protein
MVTLDIHEDDDGVVSWTLSDGGNPDRKPSAMIRRGRCRSRRRWRIKGG